MILIIDKQNNIIMINRQNQLIAHTYLVYIESSRDICLLFGLQLAPFCLIDLLALYTLDIRKQL